MTTLNVPDVPKTIRETLCRAQAAIGQTYTDDRVPRDIDLIGRLIEECYRHRPIGPDGKHGDRHTETCGCNLPPPNSTKVLKGGRVVPEPTYPFEPDWAVGPSAYLREFLDRWSDDPAGAIARASTAKITAQRAAEMISGEGEPWTLVEAADIGFIMGPSAAFWQSLLINQRNALACGAKELGGES